MGWLQYTTFGVVCDDPLKIGCRNTGPVRVTTEAAAQAAIDTGWHFCGDIRGPCYCKGCNQATILAAGSATAVA